MAQANILHSIEIVASTSQPSAALKLATTNRRSRRLHRTAIKSNLELNQAASAAAPSLSEAVITVSHLHTQAPLPTMMEPVIKKPTYINIDNVDNHIVTDGGVTVLGDLAPGVVCRRHDTAMVLGFATSTPTARADVDIGKLLPGRFMALPRTSLWWMTPHWGTHPSEIPGETQFLLKELHDGVYAIFLPLIDSSTFRATLRNGSTNAAKDHLGLRIESGDASVTEVIWSNALYVAAGKDPFQLIEQGVAAAAAASGRAKPRAVKEVPPSVNMFGWCTWDAFYSKVSASGIQQGLKSLVNGGAPPRWLIIDDGWQQTDVDPVYRPLAEEAALAAESSSGSAACIALDGIAMGSAVREVEEAAAELLAGPGDPLPEQLHGEHVLEEEEEAAEERKKEESAKSLTKLGGDAEDKAAGVIAVVVAAAAAVVAAVQERLAASVSHFEAWLFRTVKNILDSSSSDSWVVRTFTKIAQGPLKDTIKRFYAFATDHSRRLTSIEANAKFAGPASDARHALNSTGSDFGSVISDLKQRYGLQYVYAWHAMGAFWGGLGLNDSEMTKYNPQLLHPTPLPGILEADPAVNWIQPVLCGVSLPMDPTQLHHDMHAYLKGCGVDGVKVDVQGTIGLAGSADGGGAALAAAYHKSLEASVKTHFPGNHLINCMCHSTEDCYNWEDSNLARVSDDFYPLNVASHTSHIANCGYNTLFLGELAVPDFDMFHSQHPAAVLHATARAISGGPVYVSDRPGCHDFELLKRLVLPDGSVLRCHLPGRPTADTLFCDVTNDETTALKLWNVNAVTGVVGVFNIQGSSFSRKHRKFYTHNPSPPTLTAWVKPGDVAPLAGAAELYCLYSDALGTFNIVEESEGLNIVVPPATSDVVVVAPVVRAGPAVLFAPIGLTNLFNAGGAVESLKVDADGAEGGLRCEMEIRGCGSFLAFVSHCPAAVLIDGAPVDMAYDATLKALRFQIKVEEGHSMRQQCVIKF